MATKKEALTMEQLIAAMAETRASAEKAILDYNACEDKETADNLSNQIKEAKKQWNEYSRQKCLLECLATEAPIVEACKRSTYAVLKTPSDTLESGAKVLRIEEGETLIDLTGFNRSLLNAWFYKAELLCLLMTQEAATSLGYSKQKVNDDIVRFFKLSKEAAESPKASKTTLKKAIPEIIAAMIGEEYGKMVLPCDIRHFIDGFTADDKNNRTDTKVGNVKKTVKLLADICNRILTDGQYRVVTKQLKKES